MESPALETPKVETLDWTSRGSAPAPGARRSNVYLVLRVSQIPGTNSTAASRLQGTGLLQPSARSPI